MHASATAGLAAVAEAGAQAAGGCDSGGVERGQIGWAGGEGGVVEAVGAVAGFGAVEQQLFGSDPHLNHFAVDVLEGRRPGFGVDCRSGRCSKAAVAGTDQAVDSGNTGHAGPDLNVEAPVSEHVDS